MLAPIRRPGRRQRGGDTVVIHGSQSTPLLMKSGNEAEIDENESEEEICNNINGTDEKDEKTEESERIEDTPVPPRFTKAVIWT